LDRVLSGEDDRIAKWYMRNKSGISAKSADYDDALQEARIALVRAAEKFSEQVGAKWMHYACVCIRRQIALWMRREARRGFLFRGRGNKFDNLPNQEPLSEALASRRAAPESATDLADTIATISRAVGGLPQRLRDVAARRVAGLTPTEIAAELSMPVNTVTSLWHTALLLLREKFSVH
jgi:RNA polymerase sigma factor (sigma-70 family)